MTAEGWTAEIVVRCASPADAERLHRVLGPESTREVPRARARLERSGDAFVRVVLEARDTGALRAGLQTFLGWVQLEAETMRTARAPSPAP